MQRDWETFSRIQWALMAGVFLLGFAFLTPSAGNVPDWAFFQAARDTTWERWFEWSGAWCSLKIILVCLGAYLVMDSLGVVLLRFKWAPLAHLIFYLILLPCLGVLVGGYYLVKSIL